MISKTEAELLDALDQTYAMVDKDKEGKVIKANECLRCSRESLEELQRQASINQKVNDEKIKQLENEKVAQEELKEKSLLRLKVIHAYTLYNLDLEKGLVEENLEIEEWFSKYRTHETNEIIDNLKFKGYLSEVELE